MYGCNVNPEDIVLLMGLCLLPLLAVSCSWVWALTPQAPITSSHILVLLWQTLEEIYICCWPRSSSIIMSQRGSCFSGTWLSETRESHVLNLYSLPPQKFNNLLISLPPPGSYCELLWLIYIYIYFKTLILLFFIYYLLIWERERERERDTVLLFHLLMYSLVDSCMCPDWGLNPQQDDALTNWATWPGFWFIL